MKTFKKAYSYTVWFSCIIRIISGPFIIIFPLISSIINFILDWCDGEWFKRAGYYYHQYSFIDKLLDLYWYLWIFIFINYKPFPLTIALNILFIIRLIGQCLYFLSKKRIFFLLFPNIFEVLFLYILLKIELNLITMADFMNELFYIEIFLIIIIVLIREYIVHIKKANLSYFWKGKKTYWRK